MSPNLPLDLQLLLVQGQPRQRVPFGNTPSPSRPFCASLELGFPGRA